MKKTILSLCLAAVLMSSCTAIPRAGLAAIAGGAGLIGGYVGGQALNGALNPAPVPAPVVPAPAASSKVVHQVISSSSTATPAPAPLPPIPPIPQQ